MTKLRLRCAVFALLCLPLACNGGSPKIAPDLNGIDPHSVASVIVQFATPPDRAQQERVNQVGGVEQAELPLIQGVLLSIPARALNGLANDPNVVYISLDR